MAPYLVLHGTDGSSTTVPLSGDAIGVGRAPANQLAYPEDSGLSRNHLVFEPRGQEWVVRDVGSKNGTRVNGVLLTAPRKLEAGDRVTAGHLILDYCVPVREPAETVVFVPAEGAERSPATATLSIDLAGALEGKLTAAVGSSRLQTGTFGLGANPQMMALIRAGRELAGRRSLEELFHLILDLSIDAVSATRGILMTLENGTLLVRARRGDGFRISSAVRDRVLREKASLLVRDVQLDEAFRDRVSIVEQHVRRFLAVPLQTADEVIGLIYVDASDIAGEFHPEDLSLLTVMANVAAIRIEHARLAEVEAAEKAMAWELQQAAELQRQFLPTSAPVVPGLELAGYNAACRTVGGDYYAFHHCPDGRLALVVGDVAGKGMPAALLMSNLQAKAQVLLEQLGEVGGMVTSLNRLIAGNCPENRFITFFLGVIGAAREDLVYCNAGHNPPLVIRADGRVEWLKGGGLILGVRPRAKYQQRSCRLERGDIVLLYSDGVTEATRPATREEFGEARLSRVVAAHRQEPAPRILQHVRRAVDEWSAGAPPADDVTLVIARRTA